MKTALTLLTCISLTVILRSQCTDPNAQFAFVSSQTIFCEGGAVVIDNLSDVENDPSCIVSMTLNWDYPFGGVETFTDFNNRSHVYDFTDSVACLLTLPKTFDIRLCIFFSTPGVDNCITKQVKVRPKPVARFSIDNPICINDPDQCPNNTSCADSMWVWNFTKLPNGNTSTYTTEEPCHIFNQLGAYSVSLIAKNSCGADTSSQTIQVIDSIAAQGTISQLSGCGSLAATLTDNSNNPPVVATGRKWIITPATGWAFTDSTNAASNPAKVTFFTSGDYTVELEVTSVCNKNKKLIGTVHLAGYPSADIDGATGGCLPHSITPSAIDVEYANSNSGNMITWMFPGGSPASGSGENPGTVQYTMGGTFSIIMTISNECGAASDTAFSIVGQPAETNVQMSGIPAGNCGPFILTVNNTSTGGLPKWWITPNTPGAFTYVNGTNSTHPNPQISFVQSGNFTLHFSLLGAGCGSDTSWSAPIVVKTPPDANLAYIPTVQCVVATIIPDTLTSNGGDAGTTYTWSFPGGNPASSTLESPGTITYPDTGQFTVTLVMTNSCGADTAMASFYAADLSQASITLPDTVCSYDLPIPIIVHPSGGGCPGFPGCVFDPMPPPASGQYTITYDWGSGNCAVQATDEIFVVHANVQAGADQTFCDTLVPIFSLTGFSPPGGVFSGKGVLPGGMYSAAKAGFGNDTLLYSYTDMASGCVFSDQKIITVFAPPTAAGTILDDGCVNESIPFEVTAADVTKCTWIFGDNTPQVMQCQTTHSYATTGDFTVALIVENAAGCTDTLQKSIHISQPATAQFSLSPHSGCGPLNVAFQNESQGENPSYTWVFDNGDTSTLASPGMVIYQPSNTVLYYYPMLTLGNGCGNTVYKDTIEVKPLPIAGIAINQDTICSGDTLLIQNNSLGDPTSWLWNYGKTPGFTSTLVPKQVYFTYSVFTTYYITLMVKNDCGEDSVKVPVVVKPIAVKAFFNLDKSTFCQYEQVQIMNGATPGANVFYTFGNGNTSQQPDPVVTFFSADTFKIVQYATTGCGVDSMLQWVHILPAPLFGLANTPEACQGQSVQFTSTGIDTALANCNWDFGDNTTVDNCQPIHQYQQPGTYIVLLTMTDIITQCKDTDTSTVLIRANPVVSFSITDTAGCGRVLASFQNANNLPGYSHVWTFLPGNNTSIAANPIWLFDTAGWYSVSLKTTDNFGCYDDTTVFQLVHVHPVPDAAFALLASKSCQLPATLKTKNLTTGALGYEWAFSNGLQSNFTDTTLVFMQPGSVTAVLIASNEFQCRDTAIQMFTIYPEIKAYFEMLKEEQCARYLLEIENLSQNTNHHTWIFSNGDQTTGDLPNYAFQQPGIYDITLVATLDTVCSDTFSLQDAVDVLPSPVAGFILKDTVVGVGWDGTIVCLDTSLGAVKWHYDFGDGATSIERNPDHRYFTNGEKHILQTVENEWNCMDTALVIFTPTYFDGLFIPNALMPDEGSGEYAVFQPKGVGLKTFSIEVIAPWGEKLWESDALAQGQPAEYWDGTAPNGKPVPQGAYVWKVEAVFEDGSPWHGQNLNGDKIRLIGSVTVIR